jgi:hypothetical protein
MQACRDAFFNDTLFSNIGVWDKYAFDGNSETAFKVRLYDYNKLRQNNGSFRLDLGEITNMDSLVFNGIPENFKPETVENSEDLSSWNSLKYSFSNDKMIVDLSQNIPFRYLRLAKSPSEVAEIEGFSNQEQVNRENWKASNLFGQVNASDLKLCWKYEGILSGIGNDAWLSVTVPARCREESVFVWMIADGEIIAANDRAPSFPYNNWEHYGVFEQAMTFYIPVDKKLERKKVQVMLLSTDGKLREMKPEVWLCNRDNYLKAELILE